MRIALLTDFGTRDPYVAAIKGVLASHTDAAVFDLSHEIPPFDVWEAAFFLRAAVRYWPAETIFVAVIDPGVGTARRIIAVESDRKVFLAPDNGVLTFIEGRAYSVDDASLFLPDASTTFHGRDRFAPVAAAIANGRSVSSLGSEVRDRVKIDYQPGSIIAIDRFGNAITDIRGRPAAVRVRGVTIARWSDTYTGDGPFLIVGSTGCVEISIAQASAAALLQLRRGDRVEIVTS